jgi:hypothetical protein
MTHLPLVISADYKGGYLIRLTFNDGTQKTVDFRRWLEGPMFEPLLDPSYFKDFRVEGGTVVWPNGADIAPETLHDAEAATEAA